MAKEDLNTTKDNLKRTNTTTDVDIPYEYFTRGLHNWKNLFRKPNLLEWTILFMLIMVLFIAWAYQRDTAVCRDFLKNFNDRACLVCEQQIKDTMPQIRSTECSKEETKLNAIPEK